MSIIQVDGKYANIKEYACCFLLIEGKDCAIIEPTTNNAIPHILEALKKNNLTPDNVKYVIITHVHLDHSGGTALLVNKYCKNAKVLAHPKAARFLINPVPLIKGVKGVYGDKKTDELYGKIDPIKKERIINVEDKQKIKLGERELQFYFTLGHATHHMIIYDDKTKSVFSGDSFGLHYPCFGPDHIYPATTPIDFVPKDSHASVDLIVSLKPNIVYLTHFGPWKDIKKGAKLLHEGIDEFHSICKKIPSKMKELSGDEGKIRKWIEDEIYKHMEKVIGKKRDVLEAHLPIKTDTMLNAFGLLVYVKRRQKKGLEI